MSLFKEGSKQKREQPKRNEIGKTSSKIYVKFQNLKKAIIGTRGELIARLILVACFLFNCMITGELLYGLNWMFVLGLMNLYFISAYSKMRRRLKAYEPDS